MAEAAEWGAQRSMARSASDVARSVEGVPALQPVAVPPAVRRTVWRIDKDDILVGVRILKENLVRLLVGPSGAAAREHWAHKEQEYVVEDEAEKKAVETAEERRRMLNKMDKERRQSGRTGAAARGGKRHRDRAQARASASAPSLPDGASMPNSHSTAFTLSFLSGPEASEKAPVGDKKRRHFVIDLNRPRFLASSIGLDGTLPWRPTKPPADVEAVYGDASRECSAAAATERARDCTQPQGKRRRTAVGGGKSADAVAAKVEGTRGVDGESDEDDGEWEDGEEDFARLSYDACGGGGGSGSEAQPAASSSITLRRNTGYDVLRDVAREGSGSEASAGAGVDGIDPALLSDPRTAAEAAWRREVVRNRAPGCDPWALGRIWNDELNDDQRRATDLVLRARDYALVQGMPGTGKTTVIAFLIRALLSRGCSVLLSSHTHTAVDNVLTKLIPDGVDFLRLGTPSRIHPDVRPYALHLDSDGAGDEDSTVPARRPQTVAELSKLFQETKLVGCTCLGVRHTLFTRRFFDVCIVDEAGQLTQPATLGPLRSASTFVLVGDHKQLAPVVRSEEARKQGYDESLFKRLCTAHPDAVARLRYQYRMARPIMEVANALTYDQQLQCGTTTVAEQRLAVDMARAEDVLPLPAGGGARHSDEDWLLRALDPERCVVFGNTDTVAEGRLEERLNVDDGWSASRGMQCSSAAQELVPAAERHHDGEGRLRAKRGVGGVRNATEARITCALVRALVRLNVGVRDVGVIAPYRAHLRLVRGMLSREIRRGLEVETVDKFQGRDKAVVIVSTVRSNTDESLGDLLQDARRINVAFTRAKCKLVVIGSRHTLVSSDKLKTFIDVAEGQGGRQDLPPAADRAYPDLLSGE